MPTKNAASIKEVAKVAGVSITTVSRCLNSPELVKAPTLERVQEAINRIGYAPNSVAQSFRRGRTGLISVVVPSIGIPFMEEVMKGVNRVAQEEGYSVLIREAQGLGPNDPQAAKLIFSRESDGILLLASPTPFSQAFKPDAAQRLPPIVLCGESISAETTSLPCVRVDNFQAAFDATNYLIQLGHSSIGFIGGRADSLLTRDRERGYRQALEQAQLTCPPHYQAHCDQTLGGAQRATRKLLNSKQAPTAIFCANDEMALAAMHEAKHLGFKLPHDLSIMGFDDIRFAAISDPALTTLAQPAAEIGERAMYKLIRSIQGEALKEDADVDVVPHRLVVRDSTAPPPT